MSAIPESVLLKRNMSRHGNRDRYNFSFNSFKTNNGHGFIWRPDTDGLRHFLADVTFLSADQRLANVDAIELEGQKWVSTITADEFLTLMDRAGVPCAKIAARPQGY